MSIWCENSRMSDIKMLYMLQVSIPIVKKLFLRFPIKLGAGSVIYH